MHKSCKFYILDGELSGEEILRAEIKPFVEPLQRVDVIVNVRVLTLYNACATLVVG